MSQVLGDLSTPAAVPVLPNATLQDIDRRYRYWRARILLTTIFAYAIFYFVRTNIKLPLKSMGSDLGYTKEQLGIIISVGGVTYGVSKFINGFLGDHANPRYFMAIGLLGCAVMNFFFGLSSSLLFLTSFWFVNNYAQGMGFPPCAKSMAYWFSPRERASTFGVWHTSHMIGAALVSVLTGYLVHYFGWRSCFYVPAAIAVFGALIIYLFLRDTPASLGLPPVEIYKGEETPQQLVEEIRPQETYGQVVFQYILKNPYMWIISFANLSTYMLRETQSTWGPTFLQEAKGVSVVVSGWLGFGSEMGGMLGAIVAGFATDRVFGGRAGRVCVLAMGLLAAVIPLFWVSPPGQPLISGALFVLIGFLLYVPQMLIASMAMNLGTKRASAAAVGLTGIIGYMSTIITGWGVGRMADRFGWAGPFALMLGCTVVTLLLMAFTWNIGAHPQQKGQA